MNAKVFAIALCLPLLASAQEAAPASEAAPAQPTGTRVLTLTEALQTAHAHQPLLHQARATTAVSRARVWQARAPLLPQITATAGYQRKTLNFVPGQLTSTATAPGPSFNTFDFFNFGMTASQLVYDFGQSWKRQEAAEAMVEARKDDEQAAEIQVEQNVRVAFFNARAAKALVAVAHETLANFDRHLFQVQGFVRAGARAEIDLAQARTDRANAQVGVINAENGYASAKATLGQAMGIETSTDVFDVSDDGLPAVAGEDGTLDSLMQQALRARPEFVSFERQRQSLELTVGSIKGAYWPSLGISTGLTEGGRQLNNLVWNWNAGATLTWQLFQGGLTNAQVDEARANLVGLDAQIETLRQQIRVDVEQARLSVRATKAVLVASDEVVINARERLRLAEGRYATGVGNGIELADAQLALTSALAQRIQAEYNLAAARANLVHALGM